jgi:hypothetical protein
MKKKISNLDDSSKLFLYSKLKTYIKLEDYLKLTKKFNNWQLLTKFRMSDHPLEIELGRYKKIPRHQRVCKTCKVLDDEIHFFLQCQINNNLRNVLINNIKKYHANFDQLDSFFPSKNYINSWSRIFAQCFWLYKAIDRIAKMRFTLVNV